MLNDLEQELLAAIRAHRPQPVEILAEWCRINTSTHHREGIGLLASLVAEEFAPLGIEPERLTLPTFELHNDLGEPVAFTAAPVLIARRHQAGATLRALLVIHLDTVYPVEDLREPILLEGGTHLVAPGAADAKGGALVILMALTALTSCAPDLPLSWTVLFNTDEEIGSPASASLLASLAAEHDLGLVYEPALDDGALVGARQGSARLNLAVFGRAAHAGRDFADGRNAVVALARLVDRADSLNGRESGLIVNVGRIRGGEAANTVPDRATAEVSVRLNTLAQWEFVQRAVSAEAAAISRDGIAANVHGRLTNPPKPLTPASLKLLEATRDCGHDLGLNLQWRDTGGTCDGNKLAAAGLPVIDTMGVRGGRLHHPGEFCFIPSLAERAGLTALLLARLATGRLNLETADAKPAAS